MLFRQAAKPNLIATKAVEPVLLRWPPLLSEYLINFATEFVRLHVVGHELALCIREIVIPPVLGSTSDPPPHL